MKLEILKETDPIRGELAESMIALLAKKNLSGAFDEASIFQMLEKPPETHLGDYALPCFRFAKVMKRNPQQIADDFRDEFARENLNPWVERIESKGAFLNFFIEKTLLASHLLAKVQDGSYFKLPQTHAAFSKTRVMIEFSQPNTHKEFHVGHARNVCLGDSLCRIFGYLGYDVIAANYIGDEGTHVAKCLWQVVEQGGPPSDLNVNKAHWYGQNYVRASKVLESADHEGKKTAMQKISSILSQLESKNGPYYEVWKQSREECLADFKNIYKWLDVHFDHYFFESELTEEAQKIVDEFIAKGLFSESDGAIGVDLSPYKLGFFMARKSDGTTPYITKDLVLARRKFDDFKVDRSLYVVGSEQNFHFEQLFKALELMGFPQAKDCFHLSYAHVRLPEGKMSSRSGTMLPFAFLRDNLLKELSPYLEKYQDQWGESERNMTADRLAVGAIKYGMLSSDPVKEIIFDLQAWTSFEGNTGPYLMYSYARTKSILAKCAEKGFTASLNHCDCLEQASARELLRYLYDFNDMVKQACENYKPSTIANHLYNMCKAYNRFYADVPILKAPTSEERSALIALLETFAKVLKQGLLLLGIDPPERM